MDSSRTAANGVKDHEEDSLNGYKMNGAKKTQMDPLKETEGDHKIPSLKQDNQDYLLDKEVTEKDDSNKKAARDEFFYFRFVKMTALFLLWIAMGIAIGILGPSIPDLKDHFESDYEEIGRATAITAWGYIAGSMFSGVVVERLRPHIDLIFSVAVLGGAITRGITPWIPSIWHFIPVFLLNGFAMGIQNTAGNVMVLDLYEAQSATAMFMLHFGFGIGAFLGPFIAKPFLSAKIGEVVINGNVSDSYMNLTGNWSDFGNGTEIQEIRSEARLKYPYAFVGISNAVFAIIFLAYYIRGPPPGMPVKKGTTNIKDLFNPGKCADGNCIYGTLLLILFFLFYVQAMGCEAVFSNFIFTYATESDVQFTTSQAADLTSLFYLCHLTGRASGAVLSKFMSITSIITLDVIGLIASSAFLAIFGVTVPLALWIGTGLVGLLCSFLYPAGFVWLNLQMEVTSMVVMVGMFGGSIGFFIYALLFGYMIQNVSMNSFLYLEVAVCIMFGINFLCMFLLSKVCHGRQKAHIDEEDIDEIKHVDS